MKIENLQQIVEGSQSQQGVPKAAVHRAYYFFTTGCGGTTWPCFNKALWLLLYRLEKENLYPFH